MKTAFFIISKYDRGSYILRGFCDGECLGDYFKTCNPEACVDFFYDNLERLTKGFGNFRLIISEL